MNMLTPPEIVAAMSEAGVKKTNQKTGRLLLLAALAGAYVALAGQGANMAVHTITSAGLSKALAGALFATGLMMVILAGGELFTGNCLIVVSCAEKKSTLRGLLRNWCLVYAGNAIGALIVCALIVASGQLDTSAGLLGGVTLKTAVYKVSLPFGRALAMGILCNWLVCLAVWMAASAKDTAGKVAAIFFPIWLFVASGFEHSVANMYSITVGVMTKSNPVYIAQAVSLGVPPEAISKLNLGTMLLNNLLPVTIGNIIGGVLFVGLAYWFAYARPNS